MMDVAATLLLAALVPQAPATGPNKSAEPDSALVADARTRPLALREAISQALTRSVRGGDPAHELLEARLLAAAYAVAWQDSFLLREVNRFAAWPADRRAGKVWADSVRRAGIDVFSQDGATAALGVWRRAFAVSEAIADTAGMAAVVGNIGAAFSIDGVWDSADTYLGRARALSVAVGYIQVEANVAVVLGQGHEARGDLAGARDQYTRAVTLHERIGDSRGLAADYNSLGLLAQDLGAMDEARRLLEAALDLNRRDGRDDKAATNLVNLAGLATLTGDYTRAEQFYRDALAAWRAREAWADAADALHGLGHLELRRGDYRAARDALRQALDIYDRTGPLEQAIAARRALAGATAAEGDIQGALDELRRAEGAADSAGASPGVGAGLALSRADLAVQLNDLPDADRWYGTAESRYRTAGDLHGQAAAQQGRANIELARGNYAAARSLLETALRNQRAIGDQRGAGLTRLSIGQLAVARGDTATARAELAQAATELEQIGDPVALAAAVGEQADLERSAGRPAAAEAFFRDALSRLADHPAPDVRWRLEAGLAQVRWARGAKDDAARELRAAMSEIERVAGSLALAERRSEFLADKWDVYSDLALVERARGLPGAAFDASERLRAREMLEVLGRGRLDSPTDTAAGLVAREQDLRRHIADLTRGLEGRAGRSDPLRGPDLTMASGVTREALLQAQRDYGELLLEMRERAPRHADLVSPQRAAWRDVARRLAPHEALLEYLVSDSSSLAFVVTSDTIGVVDLGVGRRELARLVEFTRGTLEPPSASGDGLWRAPLRRLYQNLISPIEDKGYLAGKTRLVIVPHAELHYLPFAALIGGNMTDRFLIERYEIAMAPSASVWLSLGDRPPSTGVGVLALAPRPDRLVASRREVSAIPRIEGGGVQVLTGKAATEEAFLREAQGRRVLHLATYGVLNKPNPLFSFVELAPSSGADGRLEVHEVFGLHLDADLVVLSACQTGLGSGALADVPAGDDWVGLTRAFLHAGAAHVVATLWPVEDDATATLMERFYQRLALDAPPASALADAQRRLIARPSTAHPYYWAGFVTVEGSRRATGAVGVERP